MDMISQKGRCISYQINSFLFLVYPNIIDAIDLIDLRVGRKSRDGLIDTERLLEKSQRFIIYS